MIREYGWKKGSRLLVILNATTWETSNWGYCSNDWTTVIRRACTSFTTRRSERTASWSRPIVSWTADSCSRYGRDWRYGSLGSCSVNVSTVGELIWLIVGIFSAVLSIALSSSLPYTDNASVKHKIDSFFDIAHFFLLAIGPPSS